MNRFEKYAAAASIAAMVLGAAGGVYASSDADGPTTTDRVQPEASAAAPRLAIDAIVTKLRGAGYTDIREVERERDRYEVKARNADGRRVELYVDARSGGVLKEESED